MQGDGPTLVKRYAGGRLYEARTARYVAAAELLERVGAGAAMVVREAHTGVDVTREAIATLN